MVHETTHEDVAPNHDPASAPMEDRRNKNDDLLVQHWAMLVADIDEALFTVDRNWHFTSVNRRVATMWGRAPEELLGKVMWNEFPSLLGSPFEMLYRQAMADGKPNHLQAPSRLTQAWYDVRVYPIAQGLIIYFQDITTRKELEQSLHASETRFRALSEASFEGVVIHDNGVVIDANQIAAELYGYESVDDLVGQPIKRLIDPDSWEDVQRNITTGLEAAYEFTAVRKDGSRFMAEVRAKCVTYQNQRRRIGTVRDITEQKQAEAQRVQMQKMESIVRLAAGVAHEFNNRLAIIMSSTELALRELPADTTVRADLHETIRAVESAAQLVKHLLAFAREQIPDLQAVNVSYLIRDMQPLLRHMLPDTIELLVVCDPELPLVYADATQIQQVLMNLLANAHDALPTGGTITLRSGLFAAAPHTTAQRQLVDMPPGSYLFISVQDTGAGMDEATQHHIFEPFFTTKEPGKGTGLGLAVSYGIVKEHGGFMTCSSIIGQGTTFTLYLPLADQAD